MRKKKKKNRKLTREQRALSAKLRIHTPEDAESSTDNTQVDDAVAWLVPNARKTIVVDVLMLKQIERDIGRALTDLEIETARYGEPLFYQKLNGLWDSAIVPTYIMPQELQVNLEDLTRAMIEKIKWAFVTKLSRGVSFESH